MQAYGSGFAKAYNSRWSDFAREVAPHIRHFYETTAIGQLERTLLDLCCGTGQLAVHFLEQGYRVVGIDLSQPMLHFAQDNAREYVSTGRAAFIQADATSFRLNESFGLVVSTFDALNHLPDEQALMKCFQRVFNVCKGIFVFDLNTRRGLEGWNGISIDDGDEGTLLIIRGIYDREGDRAWTRITGFSPTPDGLFERFDQTSFNTAFEMKRVREMLLETGWRRVHFARIGELNVPIDDPEYERRVFVVASK
ncbi:MAG: class I SAM-dependent methyltransferase [Firmicutes bacterium]|nr:class I SAM-dependent methyltransferase [Bacillota bacterium]